MQIAFLSCLILFCFFPRVSSFGGTVNLGALTSAQGLSLQSADLGADFGTSIASCDFNGDGEKDLIIGAPNANFSSGAVIIVFGGSNLATVDLSDPAASGSGLILTASGQTGFGTKVACLGNANADNATEELLIGEAFQTTFWVVFGQNNFSNNQDISSLLTCEIYSQDSDVLLDAVAVGDVTGDGKADVIISADDGDEYRGVLIMNFLGPSVDISTEIIFRVVFITNDGQSEPMTFASAGNFNGDSYSDFVVGNLQGTVADSAVVIFGTNGLASLYPLEIDLTSLNYGTTPQALFITGDPSYSVGASVGYAGDVNGDTFDDILVGAPEYGSGIGAVFIVFGSSTFASDPSLNNMPTNSEGYIMRHGTETGLYLGKTIFGGLFTGSDPVFAVCDQSTNCYIRFGAEATIDLDDMLSEDGFKIYNNLAAVNNPMQIVLTGDVNSDGSPDYLIGQGSISTVFIVYGSNKCTSPCKTCSGLTAASWTSCTSCESGLGLDFLYNNDCLASCPSGSYQDSSTTCAACDGNCLECSGTDTFCTSCDPAGAVPWLYNNECVASCPSHSYQDSSTTCADCDGNCLECSGTDTFCTSCDPAGAVPFLENNVCYGSCPSHSFQDSSTTCASCDGSCLECTTSGPNACSSCDTGSASPLFFNHACYAIGSCPSHSYQDSSSTCAICNSRCLECTTTANSCTSCNNAGPYPLFSNSYCYGTCPSRTFQDSATTCAACSGNCKNCAGSATTCTSCDPNGPLPLFYSSACCSSCPPAAPFSYSYACYIKCPFDMIADSNNVCFSPSPEVPQAVKALSSTDETRKVSNEVMSTVSSLMLGGVHSIRSQSVQGPMSYYAYLNVDYPDNYGQFAKSNSGSSGLPNPFKNMRRSHCGRIGSINAYLDNQSLLANIGYSIIFLVVCVLLIPLNDAVLALLETYKKDCKDKWYHRILKRSSVSLRWSFLINQFVSKYQDLAFFSFLGIYNAGAEECDDEDILNLVVCIIGVLITIGGLVGVFLIIKNLTKKLESFSEEEKEKEEYNKDDFLGRRVILYKDLKKDQFMTMLYPFFLMVRVFGFCFVTIFLCNEAGIQLGFLNLYAVLMLFYLLKYRPLEQNGQLWMTLAYEIVGFIALLGVTLLAIYNKAGGTNTHTKTGFGYMIIIANMGMLVLNFISFFLEISDYVVIVYEHLKAVCKKLKNKNKVMPKPQAISLDKDPKDISEKLKAMSQKWKDMGKGEPEPIQSIPLSALFLKSKESGLQSSVVSTPTSAIQEGHDESRGVFSPSNMSQVDFLDDKANYIQLESLISRRKGSVRKSFQRARISIKLPAKGLDEAEI